MNNSFIDIMDVDQNEAIDIAREAAALSVLFPTASARQQLCLARALATHIESAYSRIPAFIRAPLDPAPMIGLRGMPKAEPVAAIVATALGTLRGEVFQYSEQNGGELTARIAPDPLAPADSNASAKPFGYHSDDAAVPAPYRTREIALYGVRNTAATTTGFVRADALYDAAPAHVREIACQPRFSMRAPRSFGLGGDHWMHNLPIFSFDAAGRVEIAWPTYATVPSFDGDAQAARVLETLKALLPALAVHIPVGPGDWLLFDNSRMLHGRSEIRGDRLLFRNYIRRDCNALREATGATGPIFSIKPLLAGASTFAEEPTDV